MIILASTSDLLQIITGGAGPIDTHASYVDFNGTLVRPGRKNLNISTATTSTAVPSPASGFQRNIKFFTVRNDAGAADQLVTIRLVTAVNTVTLRAVQLAAGETLMYKGGRGFLVITAAGLTK